MEKHTIKVPGGIRFISEWEEFYDIFPRTPHIMDKNVTGCGFTEWCITCKFNVILCSPRNILLDNKTAQHPGEVYRIQSSYFDRELCVDKDVTRTLKVEPSEEEEDEEETILREQQGLYQKIAEEYEIYSTARGALPKKLLVTYDSFRVLKDVLRNKGILETFFIVIDEFQVVFMDARFKSTTEMEFVTALQDIQKVCYLSATPMLDRYLEDIPEFSNLPYYELDWEGLQPGRITSPNLTVRIVNSIYQPIKKIIEEYKTGNFEVSYKRDTETGKTILIQSKELVCYVNSVYNIIQIIKKNGLKPEECNILCANTSENLKKIQKVLGLKWRIGTVPLEGEPRKMFTFCTRTTYLGADFYSDNARSVILSDANVDCLAVDISLDLPQILGRQRLWENPWKNSAEFYYKSLTDSNKVKMTREKFDAIIAEKKRMTESLLQTWNQTSSFEGKRDLLKVYADRAKDRNYSSDYVSISEGTRPVLNNLVLIAEKRAFDIQQIDYAGRVSVMSTVAENLEMSKLSEEVSTFFTHFDGIKTYQKKLQYLCEIDLSDYAREIIENKMDDKIKSYLTLGKDRLKALGYHPTKVTRELKAEAFSEEVLRDAVYQEFHEGDKLTKAEIKERLGKIYEKLNLKKSAKASDMEKWFFVQHILLTIRGKRVAGFQLKKKKEVY